MHFQILPLNTFWMHPNHNVGLLPAYFVTLEKYCVYRNVTDENARFVSLMLHHQSKLKCVIFRY